LTPTPAIFLTAATHSSDQEATDKTRLVAASCQNVHFPRRQLQAATPSSEWALVAAMQEAALSTGKEFYLTTQSTKYLQHEG
jgi:hypothetical protein